MVTPLSASAGFFTARAVLPSMDVLEIFDLTDDLLGATGAATTFFDGMDAGAGLAGASFFAAIGFFAGAATFLTTLADAFLATGFFATAFFTTAFFTTVFFAAGLRAAATASWREQTAIG